MDGRCTISRLPCSTALSALMDLGSLFSVDFERSCWSSVLRLRRFRPKVSFGLGRLVQADGSILRPRSGLEDSTSKAIRETAKRSITKRDLIEGGSSNQILRARFHTTPASQSSSRAKGRRRAHLRVNNDNLQRCLPMTSTSFLSGPAPAAPMMSSFVTDARGRPMRLAFPQAPRLVIEQRHETEQDRGHAPEVKSSSKEYESGIDGCEATILQSLGEMFVQGPDAIPP